MALNTIHRLTVFFKFVSSVKNLSSEPQAFISVCGVFFFFLDCAAFPIQGLNPGRGIKSLDSGILTTRPPGYSLTAFLITPLKCLIYLSYSILKHNYGTWFSMSSSSPWAVPLSTQFAQVKTRWPNLIPPLSTPTSVGVLLSEDSQIWLLFSTATQT